MVTIILALVFAAPAEKKQPPPLCWLHNDVKLTDKQQKIIERIKAQKSTVAYNIISLDLDGLQRKPILIAISRKDILKFKDAQIQKENEKGSILWKDDNGNSAAISFNADSGSIFAYIVYNKKVYVIESLGKNLAVVIEVDQTKFPKD